MTIMGCRFRAWSIADTRFLGKVSGANIPVHFGSRLHGLVQIKSILPQGHTSRPSLPSFSMDLTPPLAAPKLFDLSGKNALVTGGTRGNLNPTPIEHLSHFC